MDNLKKAIVHVATEAFLEPLNKGFSLMSGGLRYDYEVLPLGDLEFTVRVPTQHGMGGPRYFNVKVTEKL